MRKQIIVGAVMLLVLAAGASAQMTQEQADALQRAVARIASINYSVENVIFDGMTIREVEEVLGEPVAIGDRAVFVEGRHWHASSHGTWLVLWNEPIYSFRPVVIGFLRRGETRIRHNYVEDAR